MNVKPAKGNPFYIDFKYERLPTFCFLYDLIGHNENSCYIIFESNVRNMERNYSPELKATSRRSQPSSGQRWLLPELPRRRTNEATQKSPSASDDCPKQTDIPYKETSFQKEQTSTQSQPSNLESRIALMIIFHCIAKI
nr:uncharacterized protein LOC109179941 [Ipomoea batatas]